MMETAAPLREDPTDPIQDASPHRPALTLPPLEITTAPDTPGRQSKSPPKKKKKGKKRSSKSNSPRHRSQPTSPASTSGPSGPTTRSLTRPSLDPVAGRGGRGSLSSPGRSMGRGHSRRTRGSGWTGRLAPPLDPGEEEEHDTEDDALVRAAAREITQRVAQERSSAKHPPVETPHPAPSRVVALPSRPSVDTAASPPRAPTASVAPPVPPSGDDSDAETVAANNSEGNLLFRFVQQPTSTGVAQSTIASTRTPAPPPAPRTTTQTNPYYAPSLVPSRPVERRYEFRVLVPPSTQADTELRSILVQFFARLKEADPSLVIHPWEDRENTTGQRGTRLWKSIASPSQLPTTIPGLKKYFPRAIPRSSGGLVYPSCHLGHSKSFQALKEEIGWWFQQEQHGLWERQLQCESTYIVGWGLYSTQSMYVPELRRVLSAKLGFDIGIRWRTIQTDKSGPIPTDQLAKALHFEVNSSHRRQAKQRLAQIYARDATSFPLGIKLRLVWPLSDLMNFNTRTKVSALRLRQLQFCSNMRGMRTWELHTIDQPDERTGLTLRQRLTAIRSQKDGFQLFHSVDPSHIGDAVQFTFHPNREEEARAMVIALIPYLRWKMSEENPSLTAVERERFFSRALYRHFNRDALDRAVDAIWNPVTMSVDSPADDYNGWIYDEGDSELDCTGFSVDQTPATTLPSTASGPVVRPHDAAGDADSISTLPQGHSVASYTSQTSATSTSASAPPTTNTTITPSASTTTPSSLSTNTPPQQVLTSLTSMIDSFRNVLDLLPDNPATQAIRQQYAALPPGALASLSTPSSTDQPPSSPGPAATGSRH